MIFWVVVAAVVVAYVARAVLARRARQAFCTGEFVTLAVRLNPGKRGFGWKHGFARRHGAKIEWRGEHKLGSGADMSFDVNNLHVNEHRPVRKGETMLSDLCELVFALYGGERIELGVPRTELDTFLSWVEPA